MCLLVNCSNSAIVFKHQITICHRQQIRMRVFWQKTNLLLWRRCQFVCVCVCVRGVGVWVWVCFFKCFFGVLFRLNQGFCASKKQKQQSTISDNLMHIFLQHKASLSQWSVASNFVEISHIIFINKRHHFKSFNCKLQAW